MLTSLTFLELSENRLIDLPTSFGGLSSLQDLYLNDNLLSELPPSFGKQCVIVVGDMPVILLPLCKIGNPQHIPNNL